MSLPTFEAFPKIARLRREVVVTVIYHTASRTLYKQTIDGDAEPKGLRQ